MHLRPLEHLQAALAKYIKHFSSEAKRKRAFAEIIRRLKEMRLCHEAMYPSDSLAAVKMHASENKSRRCQ
jgi:two-component sensor histidine kinase